MVEGDSKNGCHLYLCPHGELQLPPAYLGNSPRLTGRFDPGSYQITASALGPRVCEILSVPFKSEVSISPSPLGPSKVSPADLRIQMFWGLVFLIQDPCAGEPNVGLRSLTPMFLLWENLCNVIILQFVSCPPGDMGLDYIASLPFLLISRWFLLYVFSCRRSFLVDSCLSHGWLFCR